MLVQLQKYYCLRLLCYSGILSISFYTVTNEELTAIVDFLIFYMTPKSLAVAYCPQKRSQRK